MLCQRKIELHNHFPGPLQTLIPRQVLADCAQAGQILSRARAKANELVREAEDQRDHLLESARLEFWQRANTQLHRWELERQAMCDSLERTATCVTNQAIRKLLQDTPTVHRLNALLRQLLATQVPVIKATLLCNPLNQEHVEQWLERHCDVAWALRSEENLAVQTLVLETDEGGFCIDWNHALEGLLMTQPSTPSQ